MSRDANSAVDALAMAALLHELASSACGICNVIAARIMTQFAKAVVLEMPALDPIKREG
jgi:hypothetical protein